MRSGGVRYPHTPPPQKGYLSDTCAIPYENKANGRDTLPCDTLSKGYCAIWGGISHWAAKWTGSPNKSIDRIGKNCPKHVRKLCFQPLQTIFGHFSDIFSTFNDLPVTTLNPSANFCGFLQHSPCKPHVSLTVGFLYGAGAETLIFVTGTWLPAEKPKSAVYSQKTKKNRCLGIRC